MKTPSRIIREVADKYDITVEEMLIRKRSNWPVRARKEAMKRMKEELQMSTPDIAERLNLDHSTIIHHLARLNK